MVPQGEGITRYLSLPAQGQDPAWILAEMDKVDQICPHSDWREGKISGAVYRKQLCSPLPPLVLLNTSLLVRTDGGEDLQKVIVAAFDKYCVSNPLHPDVFPAVRKMEAEIVAMVLKMFNNPGGAGVTTSGGTESIVMAVKTYRDWARATKGITEPEMYVLSSLRGTSGDQLA